MSSTSDPRDPKPVVVTGYPAPSVDAAAAASTTAYPYPPPYAASYYHNTNGYYPNPVPNPNGYYPNPNPNHHRDLFFRRLLIVTIAAFVVVGAASFILWLVLRPRLPDFSLSSLDVSSFNLSSSNTLSSQFDISLTVKNPNSKMSIYYDDVTAGVLFDGDTVADTVLPPFYQKTGNSTEIAAKLVASGVYVDDDVAGGIRRDWGKGGDGTVRFSVRVLSIVRFNRGAWRTRRHMLKVFCDGVMVRFVSSTATVGSMVGAARGCQVEL